MKWKGQVNGILYQWMHRKRLMLDLDVNDAASFRNAPERMSGALMASKYKRKLWSISASFSSQKSTRFFGGVQFCRYNSIGAASVHKCQGKCFHGPHGEHCWCRHWRRDAIESNREESKWRSRTVIVKWFEERRRNFVWTSSRWSECNRIEGASINSCLSPSHKNCLA